MANLAAPHDGYRRATQRFTMVRRDLCDALPDGSLDDHELRVCLALSRHVDPWTETWTGTLASSRACGWSKSRSTLLRTLRTLMEKGWIEYDVGATAIVDVDTEDDPGRRRLLERGAGDG